MSGKHKGMFETSAPMVQSATPTRSAVDGLHSPDASTEASSQDQPFETALSAALRAERIADARTLVANAEAVLMAHSSAEDALTERATQAQLAAAKARIAIAVGDGGAARAILVKAIETNPEIASLRTLMTEVMMAEGRATDVRPVLRHLGNSTKSSAPSADTHHQSPNRRDTSG